jgi:hypothetical protein
VLPGLLDEPVGLAFIDGNHVEEPTLRYHRMIWPVLDGVAVFDDITHSKEMRRAWKKIRRSGRSMDLGEVGVIQTNAEPL